MIRAVVPGGQSNYCLVRVTDPAAGAGTVIGGPSGTVIVQDPVPVKLPVIVVLLAVSVSTVTVLQVDVPPPAVTTRRKACVRLTLLPLIVPPHDT